MVSFWNKVNKNTPNGCWEWIASTNGRGYDRFRFQGKAHQAHRVSYQLNHGVDPKELYVCHTCDNKSCVNPEHLFLGTQFDNMQDKIIKGRDNHTLGGINRNKTYCIHGHEYTPENTYTYHTKTGYTKRKCLTCNKLRKKKK